MIANVWCPKCRASAIIVQGAAFACGCGYYTPKLRVIDVPSVDLQPVGQIILWVRTEPEFLGRIGITVRSLHSLRSPAGREMARCYIRPIVETFSRALIEAGKMDKSQEAEWLHVLTTEDAGDVKFGPLGEESPADQEGVRE